MIAHVPDMFRPRIRVEYPPDNKQIFEEWFFENVKEIPGDRVYLPVFWTSFQVNNDYGKGRKMADLQAFIDSLDRSKKYFTITQYDDGPLVDFKDLDIKVFGSGGGRIDCAIPLVCMPHPYEFETYKEKYNREYLASFIGSVTHPIRSRMIDVIKSLPKEDRDQYYISTEHHSISEYCRIMSQSIFALCPRGYGKSSFRICEALQYNTTPVYISDEFILPFDDVKNPLSHPLSRFEREVGIVIDESSIGQLHGLIYHCDSRGYESEGYQGMSYQNMYTFDSLKKQILEWLKRLS